MVWIKNALNALEERQILLQNIAFKKLHGLRGDKLNIVGIVKIL